MGLFNSKSKQQLKNINGYIIDELTGMLVDVPKGLQVYRIPKEVKQLDPNLNLMDNRVLSSMSGASEIIFEDGSIDKVPEGYFTFGSSFSNLKKLTLPNGIKNLGNNCIDPTRTMYNLPTTIEHLGKNMYPEVQRLVIGNNVKSLSNGFASHDTNLVYVEVAGSIKELPIYFVNQCRNLKTLVLHEGVEKAGQDAFFGLNGLEYIELPDSFKMPFATTMQNRSGSNKRGNSKYDGANGVFEAQQNSVLTIKKTHNGISYTFQVRRGDFAEISFQNTTVRIKSSNSQYKDINIDLTKLNPSAVCQVNIQESKVQQSIQQPVQNPKPIQQTPVQPRPQFQQPIQSTNNQQKPKPIPIQTINPQPTIQPTNTTQSPVQPINSQTQQPKPKTVPPTTGDSLDSGYTDAEINSHIQEIWQEYIYKTDSYKNLNPRDKADIGMLLNREIKQRFQRMKRGQRLDVNSIDYLFDTQVKKLNEPKVKQTINPNLADQQRKNAESQVVPVVASQSKQEEIDLLKTAKIDLQETQKQMAQNQQNGIYPRMNDEYEDSQDHGMSM